MTIDFNDTKRIAELARLDFSESELTAYTEQLNQTLQYIEELKKINTDNIEPTHNVLTKAIGLREDKAVDFPGKARIIQNGPDVSGTSFVVPRIL